MLFRTDTLEGIRDGRITLAFRRWRQAPPKDGATQRTAIGVLRLDRVREVVEDDITDAEARQAGATSRDALLHSLGGDGRIFRVELHLEGADPRVALRDRLPDQNDLAALRERLARLDKSADAPWTFAVLRLIGERPATLAARLADVVGMERLTFKRRVRHLKELGLTESLDVGYRLSRRGRRVIERGS